MNTSHTLSNHRGLRSGLLCLLYFCQGLPWGFATIALLATLSAAGHDKAETATVIAMCVLPWTFKFFWAPLIDSVRMPKLGLRRPWIAFAQFGMAVTLFGIWFSGELESEATLIFIAWVFFVHNCFASLQDVATDALSIDLLDDQERGKVLGWMWASKAAGVAVGGAGMAVVISQVGINSAIFLQAVMIMLVLFMVIAIRERPTDCYFPWGQSTSRIEDLQATTGLLITFRAIVRAMSVRTTITCALIALMAFIAEGLFAPLSTEFFIQHLGWTAGKYAGFDGTLGVLGGVVGALLGGYLASRYSARWMAALGFLLMMLTLLTFGLTSFPTVTDSIYYVWIMPTFSFCVAFASVSLFSLFMTVSWTTAAATQFTLYMALLNFGYAFGAKLNAWVVTWGYSLEMSEFYILGACLPVFSLILLLTLNPDGVTDLKKADRISIKLSTIPDTG